ncbi:hypothetical protein [Mesorhizobium sp.]|uniref:hypothetical protein n=1 Tax=Mesorhizobium sp. TaxID=1871066 RepID=UPI000FE9FC24|nr:hypothetical protein [Mesorhizobium sp.]RWP29505.1 MAG: hypothetical protein EOR03_26630 [Mesorhizobium sp.]
MTTIADLETKALNGCAAAVPTFIGPDGKGYTVRQQGVTSFVVDSAGNDVDEFILFDACPLDRYMQDQGYSVIQAPAEPVQFVCTTCTYPSRKVDCCDNPACLSNPSLSESFKQSLRDRAAAYQAERVADEARRANRAALRRQGFTTAF